MMMKDRKVIEVQFSESRRDRHAHQKKQAWLALILLFDLIIQTITSSFYTSPASTSSSSPPSPPCLADPWSSLTISTTMPRPTSASSG